MGNGGVAIPADRRRLKRQTTIRSSATAAAAAPSPLPVVPARAAAAQHPQPPRRRPVPPSRRRVARAAPARPPPHGRTVRERGQLARRTACGDRQQTRRSSNRRRQVTIDRRCHDGGSAAAPPSRPPAAASAVQRASWHRTWRCVVVHRATGGRTSVRQGQGGSGREGGATVPCAATSCTVAAAGHRAAQGRLSPLNCEGWCFSNLVAHTEQHQRLCLQYVFIRMATDLFFVHICLHLLSCPILRIHFSRALWPEQRLGSVGVHAPKPEPFFHVTN